MSASAQRTAEAPVAGTAHEWPAPVNIIRTNDSTFAKPGYINNISMAAMRDFIKRFTTSAAPLWFNVPGGGWVAKFETPGIKYQVAYSRKGSWTYTLRDYAEKLLPRDIRHLVKSTYYDYRITGITEAEQYDITGIVYIVYLEDETSYMTLFVHEGEITIREQLNKPRKD
jgi:hypothetical protein